MLPGMSSPTPFLSAWTFVPVSLLPLLEDLLCAGGRDVQEPPGCAGVQLVLVPTQCPHIHHPHHLPLEMWTKDKNSQKHYLDPRYYCFPSADRD